MVLPEVPLPGTSTVTRVRPCHTGSSTTSTDTTTGLCYVPDMLASRLVPISSTTGSLLGYLGTVVLPSSYCGIGACLSQSLREFRELTIPYCRADEKRWTLGESNPRPPAC